MGDWGGRALLLTLWVGSLSSNDGNDYKNITSKVNSLCFKPYLTHSISFNSANNGKFSWSWILKDYNFCWSSEEEKRNYCLVFTSSIKHEFRHFHFVVIEGQQRIQKCVMHMQSCCFANLKLLLCCRSRCHYHCRRRWLSCLISSMRKQPTFHYATDGIPVKWHLRNEHRNSTIWWCVTTLIWVVLLIGRKFASTNKKNFSDLDFCSHSSDVISQGNHWWYWETNAQVQVCLNGLLW